jgi:hypothetical protein
MRTGTAVDELASAEFVVVMLTKCRVEVISAP